MRYNFCVRLGDKLVAFALQLLFQLEIVFDDSVVHDHDLAGAIAVRVSVFFGRTAMRGPAGVADSVGAFYGRLVNHLFEVAELSRGPADLKFSVFGDDGNAGGIVT